MATPPPPGSLPIPPNIGALATPQIMGSLLNYCLFGVLGVQTYIYRISFPKDNVMIKCLVYFVLVFETVQTALNGVDMYNWFGKGFGNILEFADPGLSAIYTPVMGSIMALIVQLFFCYRIWIIKKESWPLCIVIGCISTIQAVAGFIGGVKAHLVKDVAKRHDQTVLLYLWLVGDLVSDVLIAAAMSFFLLQATRKQHRQTNDVVVRIVRLTVETNSLSASIAILSLILFSGVPNSTYFITPTMVLGKLYANTLLVTFNNRAFMSRASQPHYSSPGTPSNTYHDSMRPIYPRPPSVIPFSAGLKFDEPDPQPHHITVTSQYVTDSTIGNDVTLGTSNKVWLHDQV